MDGPTAAARPGRAAALQAQRVSVQWLDQPPAAQQSAGRPAVETAAPPQPAARRRPARRATDDAAGGGELFRIARQAAPPPQHHHHADRRLTSYATLERAQAVALMTGSAELLTLPSDVHPPSRCDAAGGAPCACRFNPFLGLSQKYTPAGIAAAAAAAEGGGGSGGAGDTKPSWRPVWLVLTRDALLVFGHAKAAGKDTTSQQASSSASSAGSHTPLVLQLALPLGGEAAATALSQREWQWFTGWDRDAPGWAVVRAAWGHDRRTEPSPLLLYTFRAGAQSDMASWLCAIDAVTSSVHAAAAAALAARQAAAAAGVSGGSASVSPLRLHLPQPSRPAPLPVHDGGGEVHLMSDNMMLALPDAWIAAEAAAAADTEAALLVRLAGRDGDPSLLSVHQSSAVTPAGAEPVATALATKLALLDGVAPPAPPAHYPPAPPLPPVAAPVPGAAASAGQQNTSGPGRPVAASNAAAPSPVGVTAVTALLHASAIRDSLQRMAVATGAGGVDALLQFWCHVRAYELAHPLTAALCPHLLLERGPVPAAAGGAAAPAMITRGQPVSWPVGTLDVTALDALTARSHARSLQSRFLTADPLDALILAQSEADDEAAGRGASSTAAGGGGGGGSLTANNMARLSASGVVLAHVPSTALAHIDAELRDGGAAGASGLRHGAAHHKPGGNPHPHHHRSQHHHHHHGGHHHRHRTVALPPPDVFTAARLAVEAALAVRLLQPLAVDVAGKLTEWVSGPEGAAPGPGRPGRTRTGSDAGAGPGSFARGSQSATGGGGGGGGGFGGSFSVALRRTLSIGGSAAAGGRRTSWARGDVVAGAAAAGGGARSRSMAPVAHAQLGEGAAAAAVGALRRGTAAPALRPHSLAPSHGDRAAGRAPSLLQRGASMSALGAAGGGSGGGGASSGPGSTYRRTVSFLMEGDAGSSATSTTSDPASAGSGGGGSSSSAADFAATSAAASLLPLNALERDALAGAGSGAGGGSRQSFGGGGDRARRSSGSVGRRLSAIRPAAREGSFVAAAAQPDAPRRVPSFLVNREGSRQRVSSSVGALSRTLSSTGRASFSALSAGGATATSGGAASEDDAAAVAADALALFGTPMPPASSLYAVLATDCLAEAARPPPASKAASNVAGAAAGVPAGDPPQPQPAAPAPAASASPRFGARAVAAGSPPLPLLDGMGLSALGVPAVPAQARRLSALALPPAIKPLERVRALSGSSGSSSSGSDAVDSPFAATPPPAASPLGADWVLPCPAAVALLRALAPTMVRPWRTKWERVRRATRQTRGRKRARGGDGGDDTAATGGDVGSGGPPVPTCTAAAAGATPGSGPAAAAAAGVRVDRSVLVLLMHKYRVPVRVVVPFMEPALRAAVPASVPLPATPDGKTINLGNASAPASAGAGDGSSISGSSGSDLLTGPGSWSAIWAAGAGADASAVSGGRPGDASAAVAVPAELEGSNASLQDAASTALLISHELQLLAADEASAVDAAVTPADAALTALAATRWVASTAPWQDVTAGDLTLRPKPQHDDDNNIDGDGSADVTPRMRRASIGDGNGSTPATPIAPGARSRSGSVLSTATNATSATAGTLGGGGGGLLTRSLGRPGGGGSASSSSLLSSPSKLDRAAIAAAIAAAMPSAQPSWLGVHPVIPPAVVAAAAAAAAAAQSAALPQEPSSTPPPLRSQGTMDRSSRVAMLSGSSRRMALGDNASAAAHAAADAPIPSLPLPPPLPVPPAVSGLMRVMWTPVLTSLGADPSGSVYVLDDSKPSQPFVRRLVIAASARRHASPSASAPPPLAQCDVDFSAAARSLVDAASARDAASSPLLVRATLCGHVVSFTATEPAQPLPSPQRLIASLLQASAGSPAGVLGALHLGSPEVVDVAPCRDALAPGHALEVVTPTGHLTLLPVDAATAPGWLSKLQAAAVDAKRAVAALSEAGAGPSHAGVSHDGGFAFHWAPPPLGHHPPGWRSSSSLVAGAAGAARHAQEASLEGLFPRLLAAAAPLAPAAASFSTTLGGTGGTNTSASAAALAVEIDKRGRLNRDYQRRLLRVMLHASPAPPPPPFLVGNVHYPHAATIGGSEFVVSLRRRDSVGSALAGMAPSSGRQLPPAGGGTPVASDGSGHGDDGVGGGGASTPVGMLTPTRPHSAPLSPSQAWPHRWMASKSVAASAATAAAASAAAAAGAALVADASSTTAYLVTAADRAAARAAWCAMAARHVALGWVDTVAVLTAAGVPPARLNPLLALVAAAHDGRLPRGHAVPLPFAVLGSGAPFSDAAAYGHVTGMGSHADYYKPSSSGGGSSLLLLGGDKSAAAGGAGGSGSSGGGHGVLRGSISLLEPPPAQAAAGGGGAAAGAGGAGPTGNSAPPPSGLARVSSSIGGGGAGAGGGSGSGGPAAGAITLSVPQLRHLTATLLDVDPVATGAGGRGGGGSGGGGGGGGKGILQRVWAKATGRAGKGGGSNDGSDWAAEPGAAAARRRSGRASSFSAGGDGDGSGGAAAAPPRLRLQPQVVLHLATRDRTWELRLPTPHAAAALATVLRVCGPVRQGRDVTGLGDGGGWAAVSSSAGGSGSGDKEATSVAAAAAAAVAAVAAGAGEDSCAAAASAVTAAGGAGGASSGPAAAAVFPLPGL